MKFPYSFNDNNSFPLLLILLGSEQSWPVLPGKLKSLLLPLTLIFLITNHEDNPETDPANIQ